MSQIIGRISKHSESGKFYHIKSKLVVSSKKDNTIIGRIEDGKFVPLNDKNQKEIAELCLEYGFAEIPVKKEPPSFDKILSEWVCIICHEYAVNIVTASCCGAVSCQKCKDRLEKRMICPVCRVPHFHWNNVPKAVVNTLRAIPDYFEHEKKMLEILQKEMPSLQDFKALGFYNLSLLENDKKKTEKLHQLGYRILYGLIKNCFVLQNRECVFRSLWKRKNSAPSWVPTPMVTFMCNRNTCVLMGLCGNDYYVSCTLESRGNKYCFMLYCPYEVKVPDEIPSDIFEQFFEKSDINMYERHRELEDAHADFYEEEEYESEDYI